MVTCTNDNSIRSNAKRLVFGSGRADARSEGEVLIMYCHSSSDLELALKEQKLVGVH